MVKRTQISVCFLYVDGNFPMVKLSFSKHVSKFLAQQHLNLRDVTGRGCAFVTYNLFCF